MHVFIELRNTSVQGKYQMLKKVGCLTAGAVLQYPQDCLLIVEYLPGGTLKDWLHGTDAKSVFQCFHGHI